MSRISDIVFGKAVEQPAAEIVVEALWPGAKIAPTNDFADVDFAVLAPEGGAEVNGKKYKSNEFIALVEVKRRAKVSSNWTSTIVSLRKHHTARYAKEFFRIPTICVIVFPDKTGYFDLCKDPDRERELQRWDRQGPLVPHAEYDYEKMTWRDDLHKKIIEVVEKAQKSGE